MNRRPFPVAWVVLAFSVVSLFLIYRWDMPREVAQMDTSYSQCPTDLRMRLGIVYDKPPLVSETYTMRDNNGVSSYAYAVVGASGRTITITSANEQILDVSYLAGKLDEDGVRTLGSAPPAGNTSIHYTLALYRKEMYGAGDCRHDSKTVTFTDPHYWSTTVAREYHFDLSKGAPKSASDMLHLQGTALADPRYQEIVDDFRAFGSDEFRAKIAAAQVRARSGK